MLKKRKLAAWGAVVCLLMLAMSSVTVFAAEETTEYVPKMYASFWGAGATGCSDRAGADHKRSLQFFICRNCDRRTFLVRIFI